MNPFTFPVEASHIMMFARSVGDENPIYKDADYAQKTEAGHIIAPPTFVQSSAQFDPDYFLRPKPGQDWFGSGKKPTGRKASSGSSESKDDKKEGSAGMLHAEQHYHYHRHPKPGDVLSVESRPGKNWSKESKRAGTLKFSETVIEYRDQNGDLVVTARSVGVVTEKTIT